MLSQIIDPEKEVSKYAKKAEGKSLLGSESASTRAGLAPAGKDYIPHGSGCDRPIEVVRAARFWTHPNTLPIGRAFVTRAKSNLKVLTSTADKGEEAECDKQS